MFWKLREDWGGWNQDEELLLSSGEGITGLYIVAKI